MIHNGMAQDDFLSFAYIHHGRCLESVDVPRNFIVDIENVQKNVCVTLWFVRDCQNQRNDFRFFSHPEITLLPGSSPSQNLFA
jgi:hypothetical protein